MGLDMYLYKKTYVGNKYKAKKDQVKVVVPKTSKIVVKTERISEITEDVGYWRKANQIHAWFVANVQDGNDDCKEYRVERAQLENLRTLCSKVIKASKLVKGKIKNGEVFENNEWKAQWVDGEYIKNPTVAQRLLPASTGFFFGNAEYDQYYLEDIVNTEKLIGELLEEDDCDSFYYQSSW